MRVGVSVRCGFQFLAGASVACCVHPLLAQQAPIGIDAVALTQPMYVFDTAEQHKIRVVVVAHGLRHPFAVALLPTGDALITERGAALRLVHNAASGVAELDPTPIDGVPASPT